MLGKRRKKTDLPAVCAVIVAAGSSRRMGGENKLLLEIDGVPVLARTLSAFQKCAAIRDIVLVCREQDIMPYTELAKAFSIDKLCTVTRGGETRTEPFSRASRPHRKTPCSLPYTTAPPARLRGRYHRGGYHRRRVRRCRAGRSGQGQHQAHQGWQYRRRCRPRHACRGADPAGIPQGPAPPCAHLGCRARLQLHR